MPGPGAWCGKHNEFCNITSILPQDCNFHTLLWFLFIITRLQTPDSTNETSLLLRETNKSPPGSLWCYLCHTSQPGQVLETERREHRTEWKSWNLEREQTQSWCGHCGEEKHWRGDGDTAQTHRPGHGCPGNTGGVSRGGARGGVRSVGSGSWGDREHASLYSDVMTCITLHHSASLYSDVMTCITLHHSASLSRLPGHCPPPQRVCRSRWPRRGPWSGQRGRSAPSGDPWTPSTKRELRRVGWVSSGIRDNSIISVILLRVQKEIWN